MHRIRKKFKFEMAHILDSSYSKDCQNLHGHSYLLEVFCKTKYLNDDGMVIDFGELSKIVKKEIINKFDHKTVVNYKGPHEHFFNRIPGVEWVEYNPTAENMCEDIYYRLTDNGVFEVEKIRVHETETGYAEYFEKEDLCK